MTCPPPLVELRTVGFVSAENGKKRMADFREKAAGASSGAVSSELGNACASAGGMSSVFAVDMHKLRALGACALRMGIIGGGHSSTTAPEAAPEMEARRGKRRVARDDRPDAVLDEMLPSAIVTDPRHAHPLPVPDAPLQASDGVPTWPEEPELFELSLAMLTGGSGAPAPPTEYYPPAKATHELLVRVKNVIGKVKKEHANEMHVVPGTNGRIDQQEGRGYLLGAVLGHGLLTRTEAAAAGLDARNKLNALEKRLAEQKEAARRAAGVARKAGGEAVEKQAADAKAARQAIEFERIQLELPPCMPPPPPKPAASRKRAVPPPADLLQARFEAWCRRHDPGGVVDPVAYFEGQRKTSRLLHALQARAWKPRSWQKRIELAETLAVQQHNNQCCTCEDDVPSILCRVHDCWAFEIGMCDGLQSYGSGDFPSSRVRCDCMQHAYGDDPEQRWPDHRPPLLWEAHYDLHGERGLPFPWLDPPPGGWYGAGYDPEAAAKKLTAMDVRMFFDSKDHHPTENFPSYGKV
jgi:hypothetical protein